MGRRSRTMNSWHSLSGYLEYRTSGALGKLKGSRRLWFILEDSSSLLLFYKNKDEAVRQKDAKGKIPLQGAGISLNPREHNQFIVLCGDKEHIFTADNHESMMVWLMGLQAKRDFFTKKRLGLRSTSSEEHGSPDIIKEEYEVIPSPPPLGSSALLPTPHSLPIQPDDYVPSLPNPYAYVPAPGATPPGRGTPETRQRVILRDAARSLTTSTLDLYRRQRNQQAWRQQKLRKIIGESMDGGLDLYKDVGHDTFFEDLKTCDGSKEFIDLPELPNNFRSNSLFCSAGSLICGTEDNVFIPDSVLSADETLVTGGNSHVSTAMGNHSDGHPMAGYTSGIKKASSEGMDIDKGFMGAAAVMASSRENQRRSNSGRSGSSDSLLDRNSEVELLSQLNELEQQLITTKCEMAKLLNRETCFKEVLEKRDNIILDMDKKVEELAKRKADDRKTLDKRMKEEIRQLQNQNHFLNEEVKRLTQLRYRECENVQHFNVRIQDLEADLEHWKQDYVYVLQSTITIPTGDIIDGMDVTLYGGTRHRDRVKQLLDECRQINPCLPTFERLACSDVHVDKFGFKQTQATEGLMLHYLCQQLHTHYQSRLSGWETHQRQWRDVLRRAGPRLYKTKDVKMLCRHGVPDALRAEIWRKLVYARVGDIMDEKGPHYYHHLVNMAYDSQYAGRYRKQIMLDLLRTMPTNVNFKMKESEGIIRMKEVLQAFCMHNPDIGYCQGLNFIVGMCLLFLNTEDTFWTLVAITEKYFSPNYFDKSLTGAQADQEVLKDMLRYKLPAIYDHLQAIDIELSTVTFNWFLAVFFDAVPFQTLVHVWDCFLVDGPKVLFRFALAILKMNQPGILAKKDTINVMRHLKVCGKLMFDAQGLVRVAFSELKPFPRRRDIAAKQVVYLNALKEKLKKREAYRRNLEERNKKLDELDMIPPSALVYECATQCGPDLSWICVGEQNLGKVLSVNGDEALARDTQLETESNILSVCSLEDEMFLLGTLSRILHAYSINTMKELWCLTLNDGIFSLCCRHVDATNRLFAGMGDGTVAILDQIQPKEPCEEPFYIPVGRAPVGAIVIVDDLVWLACGNSIHIMHAESLDMVDRITISSNPFDHVLMLAQGEHGIWTTIKGSSVLELWDLDTFTCKLLYDVRYNKMVPRKGDEDGSLNKFRITTLLPVEDMLWVGTGDGLLTMYTVQDRTHLVRRTHSSGSLRGDRPCSPRDLRRNRQHRNSRRKHNSGARTRSRTHSRTQLRNSREESRSREMLINGMLDDEEDNMTGEIRETPRYRGRKANAEKKAAEVRRGMEIRHSRRSRVQELRGTDKMSTSCPGPDSLISAACQEISDMDLEDNSPKKMVLDGELIRSDSGCKIVIEPESVQSPRAKLQRQKDISKKSPDASDAGKQEEGKLNVRDGFCNASESDSKLGLHTECDTDSVFESDCKGQKHSQQEKDALRSQALDRKIRSKDQSMQEDCNMNLPPKYLPEILKNSGKTQAAPQESVVMARSVTSKMDPSKSHACSVSSVSTLTDGDSPITRNGLADDPIFDFEENYLNGVPKPLLKPDKKGEEKKSEPSDSEGSTTKPQDLSSAKSSKASLPEIEVEHYGKDTSDHQVMSSELSDGPSRITITLGGSTADEQGYQSLSPNTRPDCRSFEESLTLPRTPSSSTLSSSSFSDLTYMIELNIQTKVKVSDRPVKCLVPLSAEGNPVIISCAGCYGDDEAVLKWSRKKGESIWTNEPVLEVCPLTNMPRRPSYMQHMSTLRSYST